eukprot:9921423-Heterocapsa_arctica.AAC.1
MQRINQRTAGQRLRLRAKRRQSMHFLRFTRTAVARQRARGRPVMGEQPAGALSWSQPPIVEAFRGMPDV